VVAEPDTRGQIDRQLRASPETDSPPDIAAREAVGLEGGPKLAFDLTPGVRLRDHASLEPKATDLLNLLSDLGNGRREGRLRCGR